VCAPVTDISSALAWLADHVNFEADRSGLAAARRLDRMRRLTALMGDPQSAYPVVHITGTNGKGSTARMVTALLRAQGLSVGTYTSPHLQRVNERMAWDGQPIADDALAEALASVAALEPLVEPDEGRLTHFEILTAAALRWFADVAADVAVLEVGLGGRWDATNVADGQVAVVTNVALDHAETIGPALADIAREKAGIIKAGCTLVLGETVDDLAAVFEAAAADVGAAVWRRGRDFGWTANRLAVGGRALDLFSPGATYRGVFLPAHGRFQGDNAATAVAAVNAFFGVPLAHETVDAALYGAKVPGRLEVVGHGPLRILDGAHNPAGAAAAAEAIDEAFGTSQPRVLVVGMVAGRDPVEMLEAMGAGRARLVVACPPPSPRALAPEQVAAAAESLGTASRVATGVEEAVEMALSEATTDDLVLITGSLYVVGAARSWLLG
jgi:dihydrofolate synthase / folylpolyglutamate synthase